MNEIKRYFNCENCDHKFVCQYKGIAEEAYTKMNGRLGNIDAPEIFKFTFECTQHHDIIPKKENAWYD